MEPKAIKEIPDSIFSLYQKAAQAYKLNNLDYAIELMKTAVLKEPCFIEARKKLRFYELTREKPGMLSKTLKSIKLNKGLKVIQMKLKMNKIQEAYIDLENILAKNIYTHLGLKLLAEIGDYLEAPFISIEALELALQIYPDDFEFLKLAAETYRKHGMGKKEVEIRKKMVQLKPDDLKLRMQMREASALATMEKSDWENKEKSFTDKLKDKNESASLEAEEKLVKSEDNAAELVASLETELKENPVSIKALRELSNIHMNSGNYEKAIEYLNRQMEVKGTFDLSIDAKLEKAELKILEKNIEGLEQQRSDSNSSDIDTKIGEIANKILEVKKSFAMKRIEHYPNDLQLRFAYGKVCMQCKDIDSAIEQFQMAQGNLNKQVESLQCLGQCFFVKKQFDIATEQFMKILEGGNASGEQQLEALYYLGVAYDEMGNDENAGKCFKKIYSAKSTYKDVSERIKKYYL